MKINSKDEFSAPTFYADCRDAFSFLEKKYGYSPTLDESPLSVTVRFKGPKVLVEIQWSGYDNMLEVDIARLIGKTIPPYPILLNPHEDLFWISLRDLKASFTGKEVPARFPIPINSRKAVKSLLNVYADELIKFGEALLGGDTSLLNLRYEQAKQAGGFRSGPKVLSAETINDWGRLKIQALQGRRQAKARRWKR